METNKKPIIIIVSFLIVVVIIIFIALVINKDKGQTAQYVSNEADSLVNNSESNSPGNKDNYSGNGNNISREEIEVKPEITSKQNQGSATIDEESNEESYNMITPGNTPNSQQRTDSTGSNK